MKLPMQAVFLIAGALSVLSAVVSGIVLYSFAENLVTEVVLQVGQSQVEAATARLTPEIDRTEFTLAELKAAVYNRYAVLQRSSAGGSSSSLLPNVSVAHRTLNESLLWNWAPKLNSGDGIMGVEFDLLFPPTTRINETESVLQFSAYYEPLRDNSRSNVYQRTAASGLTWLTYPAAFSTDGVFAVTGPPLWRAPVDMNFTFWSETELTKVVYRSPQTWAAGEDGNAYWYIEVYQYFRLEDKFATVSVVLELSRLKDLLEIALHNARAMRRTPSGQNNNNSNVFLYAPQLRTIVATTFQPESDRFRGCYSSWEEFDNDTVGMCPRLPVEQSPFPYVRSVFAHAVTPEWNGDGPVAPTATLAEIDGRTSFIVTRLAIQKGELRLFVVWVQDGTDLLSRIRSTVAIVVAISSISIILASVVAIIVAVFALLRPMERLSREMKALSEFDTSTAAATAERPTSVIREVHYLQTQFAAMASTIHSFSLYVPRDVVRDMLQSDSGVAQLGMMSKHLVVMFVDIADFTTLCERLEGERGVLSRLLADYFRLATKALMRNGATIDKFIGDAVMCFWGAPLTIDEPELRAVCGGLEVLALCPQLSRKYEVHDVVLRVRIGANAGPCLCGNIGSEERMNYTALGDTVNTASRLEGLNKEFGSSFMVSATVLEHCAHLGHIVMRHLGSVVVKGKTESLDVYEVLGMTERPVDEIAAVAWTERSMSPSDSNSKCASDSGSSSQPRHNAAKLYALRKGLLVEPMDALAQAVRLTHPPPTLVAACCKFNLGTKAMFDRDYGAAAQFYEAALRCLLGQWAHLSSGTASSNHDPLTQDLGFSIRVGALGELSDLSSFAEDAERRRRLCLATAASEDGGASLDPTYVCTDK